MLAFFFGLSQGQANSWIHRVVKLLKRALAKLGHLPEREGTRLSTILRENEALTFAQDGSDRRRQRPKDQEKQKASYSGKKKAHTVKNHLVVHPECRRVCCLSAMSPGKKHNKKLADEANLHFPNRTLLEQDTGFQSFNPEQVIIRQPKEETPWQSAFYRRTIHQSLYFFRTYHC